MGRLQHFRNIIISEIDAEYTPLFFDKHRLKDFFIQFLQFAGILAIVNYYQFEKISGISFYYEFILAVFAIYSFTPLKYKPFVLFLSTILLIFHAFGIRSGSFIVFTGLSFIAICHLKIAHVKKLWLIIILFSILAFLRSEILYIPRVGVIISYLMPMFMFRIIIYLYELKHGLVPKSIWQSLVYFFMLPNVFFLFFPIVDYKTYIKNYYSIPEKDVWQKGIRWMLRGLFHIFMYRLLCTYFLISPSEVIDLPSLLHYLFSNYSLIVRMSGIFHFIVGLLCMFGMNLPQVFDNYFIATSFVDLWRRINIYWKDFVLKIFYYPIMFAYKKKITKFLLPATMISAFFMTLLLHNYQLFWITGAFNLRAVDVVFWMTIGLLITINSMVIEKKTLSGRASSNASRLIHYFINTLKITGVILFMSVMWSLWNSKTLNDWLFLMRNINLLSWLTIPIIILSILSIVCIGILLHYFINLKSIQKLVQLSPSQTFFLTAPTILFLILLEIKAVRVALPQPFKAIITAISTDLPNQIDKEEAEIGYYDRLIEGDEGISLRIGDKNFKRVINKNPYKIAYYQSKTLLGRRMKPNLNIQGLDHNFITNSYGIRDKQYAIAKADTTFRLALLGGSYEMGSGVSNNQNFEYITEDRLNAHFPDSNYKHIEIWNFAGGGYYIIEHLELLNLEVFKYNPDAIIYFAHSDERNRMVRNLIAAIRRKVPIRYKFLNDIIKQSGATPYMAEIHIKRLLMPYADCILQWCYMEMAAISKKNNARIIWAYLLTTEHTVDQEEYTTIRHFAEQAGYITLDLRDVYGDLPRASVQLSDINLHPNILGQKLIADHFYEEVLKHKKEIFAKKQ